MNKSSEYQASRREGEMYLALPPNPSSHHEARTALGVFFNQVLGPLQDCLDATFFVAVGEALSNAIEHSHSSSFIEISASVDEHRVVVWVKDHGAGFLSTTTPASMLLPADDSEHGRGLPLMLLCSDSFDIQSLPRIGTTVRLERRILPRHDLR